MPRYGGGGGGGGGGGSRSGGYKSSSSKSSSSSGSRTFKTMTKDPNAPEKVGVRYPGGLYHTFTWDDCETAEFQSQFPRVKDRPYNCKEILAYAIEYTLYEGSDSWGSRIFRRMLKEDCGGIVLDFDAKKGSATTGSVPN